MLKKHHKTLPKVFSPKNQQSCAKKIKGEMFGTFAGMTSLMSNSKICNFVKTDRNNTKLCMVVFLHKSNKICLKDGVGVGVGGMKFWPQVPIMKKQILL